MILNIYKIIRTNEYYYFFWFQKILIIKQIHRIITTALTFITAMYVCLINKPDYFIFSIKYTYK
jgi:hypothetical protein